MNRLGRATILLLMGTIIVRLVWTGGFGVFVQQHMRWPLLLAAIVLLILGLSESLAGSREEASDPASARRAVAPRVGWLLVLPFVVLLSVAPTALGAAAADRVDAYTPTESNVRYEPLDASAGPVEMRVFEFLDRAVWDENRSLEETAVRLEGLVVNDPAVPDGFKLTRFMVSCCAADGIPLQVAVRDAPAFPDDTWVVVDLMWRPPEVPYNQLEGTWLVEADLIDITEVPNAPNDPYESPY